MHNMKCGLGGTGEEVINQSIPFFPGAINQKLFGRSAGNDINQ
jgi:hypothetical protein